MGFRLLGWGWEKVALLVLFLVRRCLCDYHPYHPARFMGSLTGPPDPSNDPMILGKIIPDVIVGGPFNDYTNGPQDWYKPKYHFGKGGNNLMDTQKGNDFIFGGPNIDALYAEEGNDTIVGGPGDDHLIGGPGSDMIWGGPGDDHINGDPCLQTGKGCVPYGTGQQVWDDYIQGGPGNDGINTHGGNDEIYGDAGDDSVRAGDNDDVVYGDDGNDVLYGDEGNDFIFGGRGNDIIKGGGGNDILYGGPGNDQITSDSGKDTIYVDAYPCGATDQVSIVVAEGDRIILIANASTQAYIRGFKGLTIKEVPKTHTTAIYIPLCNTPAVTLGSSVRTPVASITSKVVSFATRPPSPPKWIRGRLPEPVPGKNGIPPIPPDNLIIGSMYSDVLYGAQRGPNWTNYMFGDTMLDYLVGGSGPDIIFGGNHHDTIYGGDGDDVLVGDGCGTCNGGKDLIWGEGGNDAIFGGKGMDFLYGGPGTNWLTGGERGDTFYVDAPTDCSKTETDTINDFSAPETRTDLGADTVYVVGNLTSMSEITITHNASANSTSIFVKGCSKPFVVVRFIGNNRRGMPIPIDSSNVRFITQDKIWRVDEGVRPLDVIFFLTNNTDIYFHPKTARAYPPTPRTSWPPPGTPKAK